MSTCLWLSFAVDVLGGRMLFSVIEYLPLIFSALVLLHPSADMFLGGGSGLLVFLLPSFCSWVCFFDCACLFCVDVYFFVSVSVCAFLCLCICVCSRFCLLGGVAPGRTRLVNCVKPWPLGTKTSETSRWQAHGEIWESNLLVAS